MGRIAFTLLLVSLSVLPWFGCGDDDCSPATRNHPPTVTSVTLAPDTVQVADTVLVSVVAHDEDGDSLTYAYDPAGGTLIGSGSAVRWIPVSITGVQVLTVVVTDERGCADTAEDSLWVYNSAPVIVSITVDPDTVRVGQSASVQVAAFDMNDDELVYAYEPSGGSITGSGPAVSWQAPTSVGSYSLSVLVSDGHAGETQGTAALVVRNNQNPVVQSVSVTPSSVQAGGTATVTVSATDPDGDALTYMYTVTGGAIIHGGAAATWTAPSTQGAHSVTVVVRDGNGGTAQGNGTLMVQAAQTGIFGTISAPPGPAVDLRNMLVRIYASLSDYQNDAPLLTTGAQGNEFQVSFQFGGLAPGNYWLDAWKDSDASGTYTANDIWAVHATGSWGNLNISPILVTQGNMTDCTSGLLAFVL